VLMLRGSVVVITNAHAIGILTLLIVLLIILDAVVLDGLVEGIVLH
jgi:hypothetical protein